MSLVARPARTKFSVMSRALAQQPLQKNRGHDISSKRQALRIGVVLRCFPTTVRVWNGVLPHVLQVLAYLFDEPLGLRVRGIEGIKGIRIKNDRRVCRCLILGQDAIRC